MRRPVGEVIRKCEAKRFARAAVHKCMELMVEDIDNRKYIWVGVCAQKRQWQEFEQFVDNLACEFTTLPDDVYLYFDGITSKSIGEREVPSEDEAELIHKIKMVMKESSITWYVIGAGLRFSEKAPYIRNTAFFVTNWLTDSM